MNKIAIFGANGSLAKSLAFYLKKRNYKIIGFSSKKFLPIKNSYDEINYFNLNQKKFSFKKFKKFKTAVIFSHSFKSVNLNIKGLNNLKTELNKFNIRQIYISSHSARIDSYSDYGRSKFLIEQSFLSDNHEIIRPGLVIINGGLFKKYFIKIKKTPIIVLPKIKNLKSFYIFESDFNKALNIILKKKSNNIYNLFNEIQLIKFINTIQKFNKTNKKILKINFNVLLNFPFLKNLGLYKSLKNLEQSSFKRVHKMNDFEKKLVKKKFNIKNLKRIF